VDSEGELAGPFVSDHIFDGNALPKTDAGLDLDDLGESALDCPPCRRHHHEVWITVRRRLSLWVKRILTDAHRAELGEYIG